jgi:hypothetical protein
LRGNLFLPISASQILSRIPPGATPGVEPKADLDLNLEPVDLRELGTAILAHPGLSGNLAGRFSIFGTLDALQGWGELHGRDVSLPNDSARFSFDGESRFSSGIMQAKASVQFAGCDPVLFDGSIPVFARAQEDAKRESFSLNVNFPAVFPARLPRFITRDTFRDGIISGQITVVGPEAHAAVSGDLQLTNGKLNPAHLHFSDISARIVFQGHDASIDFLNLADGNLVLSLHGKAGFDDLNKMNVQLSAPGPLTILAPSTDAQCINDIRLAPMTSGAVATTVDAVGLIGGIHNSWSLAIPSQPPATDKPPASGPTPIKTVPICFGADSHATAFVVGVEPTVPPAPVKARPKKSKRHR